MDLNPVLDPTPAVDLTPVQEPNTEVEPIPAKIRIHAIPTPTHLVVTPVPEPDQAKTGFITPLVVGIDREREYITRVAVAPRSRRPRLSRSANSTVLGIRSVGMFCFV